MNFANQYRALQTAAEKESMLQQLVEDALVSYRLAYDYQPGKYNEEGIALLLQNSLANYLGSRLLPPTMIRLAMRSLYKLSGKA